MSLKIGNINNPELLAYLANLLSGTKFVITLPPHLAAVATEEIVVFKAPYALDMTSVLITPSIAVSGADTNTTHINLMDTGTDRTGTTEIGNYDCTNGNDIAVDAGQELLGTDGAGTDTALDAGDYLKLQFQKVGSGLLIPASTLEITYAIQN